MLTNLRRRIDTYRMNTGTGWALWNLLILGVVTWRVLTTGDTLVRILAGTALAAALVAGAAIIPIARVNGRIANRLIQAAFWAAMITIAIDWTNAVTLPALAHLGIIALLTWTLSASFWFISSPGVLTATGLRTLQRRADRQAPDQDPLLPA